MAALSAVITSRRYDLRDTTATYEWSDNELVEYANRAVFLMDRILASMGSDLIHTQVLTLDLTIAQNYIAYPSGALNIHDPIWYGSLRVWKKPLEYIMYLRNVSSVTGFPNYWCHRGANIEFDRTADATYENFTIYYDAPTATLTTASSMPYQDRFNNVIGQAMVVMAKARNDNAVAVDAAISAMFEEAAIAEVIKRDHVKRIRLDF